MRRILRIVLLLGLPLLWACDVHEWPDLPEGVTFRLRLNYETEFIEWEHRYDGSRVVEKGYGDTYDNHLDNGSIHYIVRAYPITKKMRAASDYTHEFTFTKDISEGYDHEMTLGLPAGDYKIMVWSQLTSPHEGRFFYDASDFDEIKLLSPHAGSTDYRDAFQGTSDIALGADYMEHEPYTYDITMQRPLAKFEFITNDVTEFIKKEAARITAKGNGNKPTNSDEPPTRAINIEDYKVMFRYVGFTPNVYSLYFDKVKRSTTGIVFESTLKRLSESEATMGFDYVFENGDQTVEIGIYDNEGTLLSMSEPIKIPLKRGYHTRMTGSFLMSKATGGVTINPGFDGDDFIWEFPLKNN